MVNGENGHDDDDRHHEKEREDDTRVGQEQAAVVGVDDELWRHRGAKVGQRGEVVLLDCGSCGVVGRDLERVPRLRTQVEDGEVTVGKFDVVVNLMGANWTYDY